MRRPLYGWLTAEAISLTGTRVSTIAIPLFVLETTGSATRTGIVALAEMLPLVVLKLLGGPLIDALGARRIAVTCDLGSLVVVAAGPLLYDAGRLTFPVFVVLVAVAGALRGPGDGAKYALIPSLVTAAGVPTERVTGLAGTVERTASLIGAGAAGVLVAGIGAVNALLIDAASFGLSAFVLLWATTGLPRVEHLDQDPLAYRARLRQGWDFLRGDRLLLGIGVMVALTNMIDAAFSAVLMPVWAVRSGNGAAALGLVFATWAGASAVGALIAAGYASRLPRFRIYLIGFLITGAPRFAVMALDSPLVVVLAVFVVGGFFSGFLNPVLGAVEFERIPAAMVGRVSSMMTAMCWALMPLGGLLGGLLVGSWSLAGAFVVCGVAYFVVTMLPATDPTWREMDRRPEPASVNVS
jgi:MFS family permease